MALSALAIAALAGKSYGQQINLDFLGRNGGQTPVGTNFAGVYSSSNWNDFTGQTATNAALINSNGAATGVTLTFNANDSWNSDTNLPATNDPNFDLMKGIVKVNDGANPGTGVETFTLNGLTSGYTYSFVAYTMQNGAGSQAGFGLSAGANAQATYYVTEQNSFNGTFVRGTNTTAGTFTAPASNYVEWDNITLDASNSLTLTMSHVANTDGAGLSGFQVIAFNHWTGTAGSGGNAKWDIGNSANWSATGSKYTDGDGAIFDDTGINTNITIASGAGGVTGGSGVHPAAIQFNNNTTNYTFTGDVIAGSGSLTLNGTGTVTLSNGANSYGGGTTINAGTLTTTPGTKLGSGILSVNNTNSTGAGTNVVLNLGSAQTVSGLSGSIATPASGANTATINLGSANATLTINGSSITTFAGTITGPAGLTYSGTGNLTLSGPNTYTGGTIINSGTLSAAFPGTDTAGGALPVGQPVTVNTGATLNIAAEDGLGYAHFATGGASTYNTVSAITLNGGTITGATGIHGSLPAITMTAGTITAAGPGDTGPAAQSMNFIFDGNITVNAAPTPSVISAPQITMRGASTTGIGAGNVTAGSAITFNVARGTGTTDLLVSSDLQDETGGLASAGAGLIKTGNGIMTLTGSSTYSGGTVINAGTVAVTGINGGGSGTTPLGTGSVTINNGGTLALQGQKTGTQGLNANFYSDGANQTNFNNYALFQTHFAGQTAAVANVNTTTGGKTNLDYSNDGYGGNAPFGQATPDATTANYGYTVNANYEATLTGYVNIPSAGTYTFSTNSDDGSVLFINGDSNPVVANNFFQGNTQRTGTYTFNAAGLYPITVGFNQGGGGQGFLVQYQSPGGGLVTIPNSAVFTGSNTQSTAQIYNNNVVIGDNANANISITNSPSAFMGSLIMGHGVVNVTGDTGASLNFTSANLAGSGTINVTTADKTVTITNGVTESNGTNSLTKIGNGTLAINGASTYSGGTSVDGGTMTVSSIGGNNPFGTGTITLGGGNLNLGGQYQGGLTAQFIQDTGNVSNTPYNSLTALNTYFAGATIAATSLTSAGGKTNFDFSNTNYGGPNAMFGTTGPTTANYGFNGNSNIEVKFSGFINVPAAGTYSFATTSDDGSVVFVNGQDAPVVNNNNFQGATLQTGTYSFPAAGLYPITIGFYQGGGGEGLLVQYTPAGGTQQTLPNSVLTTGTYSSTQTYGNAVSVAQNATVNITNSPNASFGALTINGSTLNLTGSAGSNLTFTSTSLTGNAVMNPASGTTITTGAISEDTSPRTLTKSGAGTVAINGAGSYTGGTLINAGTVLVSNATALGGGAVTMNGGVLSIQGSGAAQSGFSNFTLNGGATLNTGTVTLTDGANGEARTAFSNAQFTIANGFTTSFTYQATGTNLADGAAFVIQSSSATAIGQGGGGLAIPVNGTNGIGANSDAVEFNVYGGHTIGTNAVNDSSTGNYNATGAVNVAGGDPIAVQLTYVNSTHTLTETLTDTVSNATYTTSYNLDLTIPLTGAQGYVGFSGGTGGLAATQTISNFTFSNFAPLTIGNNINIATGVTAGLDVPQPAPGAAGAATASGNLNLGAGSTLNVTGGATATNTPYSLGITGTTTLAGNATINVANNGTGAGTATFAAIGQSAAGSSLTKGGNGTLVLSGTGTYTGQTNVNAGTLAVSVAGAISGSTAINVASGATFDTTMAGGGYTITGAAVPGGSQKLAGAGTLNGSIIAGSGAIVAPSAGAATNLTLTNGSLSFLSNSAFQFTLGNSNSGSHTAPLASDFSTFSVGTGATLTLGGSITTTVNGTINNGDLFAVVLSLSPISGTFSNLTPYPGSTSTYFFNSGGHAYEVNLAYNGSLGSSAAGVNPATFAGISGGNEIALLAIPEPGAAASLLAGAGLLSGLVRFRRRQA